MKNLKQELVRCIGLIAAMLMLVLGRASGECFDENPTFQVLALSFLLLLGMMLVVDGGGQHVGKGYIYFAIGFIAFVEFINLKVRGKHARSV